jgi:acetyl esterase
MDPTLASLLATMSRSGRKPVNLVTPDEARAQIEARPRTNVRPLVDVFDDTVSLDEGRAVPLRIYVPHEDATGVIVYAHGGGWVLGSVNSFDNVARELAHHSMARVISVDYSLAPENPYPAALEEVISVIEWAAARFPTEPLAVAGDSAGGNLATVAARRIHETQTATIHLQVLFYPVTDSDTSRASYLEEPSVPTLLSKDEMDWFWSAYVPDPSQRTEPDVAPLRAGSLDGLPPTVIILAGQDPLRDEGLLYAKALEASGVPVELCTFTEMCHGFVGLLGQVGQAEEALRVAGNAARKCLGSAVSTSMP